MINTPHTLSRTANIATPCAQNSSSFVPTWLKISFTLFMVVLVPVYWANYGSTNFLYFSDAALFLTLFAIWDEDALTVSMAAVGILGLQIVWCVDFAVGMFGFNVVGITDYMFDPDRSLFLRGLSLFNWWLPCLLLYLVHRLGYDRRALAAWIGLAVVLCLIAYCLIPSAGAELLDPKHARNVNYVFGLDSSRPQTWLPRLFYLFLWMGMLCLVFFIPTHFLLCKVIPKRPTNDQS